MKHKTAAFTPVIIIILILCLSACGTNNIPEPTPEITPTRLPIAPIMRGVTVIYNGPAGDERRGSIGALWLEDAIGRAEEVIAFHRDCVSAEIEVEYYDGITQRFLAGIRKEPEPEAYLLYEDKVLRLTSEDAAELLSNPALAALYIEKPLSAAALFLWSEEPAFPSAYELWYETPEGIMQDMGRLKLEPAAVAVENIADFKVADIEYQPDSIKLFMSGVELEKELEPGIYDCEAELLYNESTDRDWSGTLTYKLKLTVTGAPETEFAPSTIYQGELMTLRVKNPVPGARYSVYAPHEDKELPFYETEYGLIALVPVKASAAAGEHEMKLRRTGEGSVAELESDIPYTISEREFTRQDLETTAETQAVYTNENAESDNKKTAAAKAETAGYPLFTGRFMSPVEARISTEFGQLRYVNGKLQSRHTGIDLAAPEGTPIAAAASGKVVFADMLNITGNTVIIDHGMGLFSSYCHMSELSVAAGDEVKQRDIVGLCGSTGYSTGPHLHYAVTLWDSYINPDFLIYNDIFN